LIQCPRWPTIAQVIYYIIMIYYLFGGLNTPLAAALSSIKGPSKKWWNTDVARDEYQAGKRADPV